MRMPKLISFLILAASALAVMSCSKTDEEEPAGSGKATAELIVNGSNWQLLHIRVYGGATAVIDKANYY